MMGSLRLSPQPSQHLIDITDTGCRGFVQQYMSLVLDLLKIVETGHFALKKWDQ